MSVMRKQTSILPLHLQSISFIREGQALLSDVALTFTPGGLTAIVGPNGAGKSLLLRICNGLIEPSHGTVAWSHNPRHRHALVFQRPVMLRRSVRSNVIHALKAADHHRVDARADEALARFGLTHLADRPARLLSGGEQQKLAIARAWAIEPDILFLDEPTSQLDPASTRDIETLLQSLVAEGITLVMITQDLGQTRRLASRILLFHKGKLVEDSSAEQFFSQPRSPEAQAFLSGELLR